MIKQKPLHPSNHTNKSRRNFIRTSLGLYIALASRKTLAINSISTKKNENKLISILNKSSSINIGQAILILPKHELQLSNIAATVMYSLNLSSRSLNLITKKELSLQLKQQTVNDFDLGNIINVEGWIMGYTEAQLCVLAARIFMGPEKY